MRKLFNVNGQVFEFQLKIVVTNRTMAEYVHHIDFQKSIYTHQESNLCSLEVQRQNLHQKSSVTVFSLRELRTTLFFPDITGSRYDFTLQSSGYRVHQGGSSLKHSLLQFEEVQNNGRRIVILLCKHNWPSVSKKLRKIHSSHLLPKGFLS